MTDDQVQTGTYQPEQYEPEHSTRDASQEHVVKCPHCGAKWERYTLYKTGDVLRCPLCDGVMCP